jgi:hypothetical protein
MLLQKDYPDHHDADIVLRLYEMRREPVMRESRGLLTRTFFPTSVDDVLAVAKNDNPMNAAFRQVSSYWEMVYGMVRQGVLHAEFMLDSNGEGLLLYARVAPYVEEYRKRNDSPRAFRNAEWVATQTEGGRQYFAAFTERLKKQLAAKK